MLARAALNIKCEEELEVGFGFGFAIALREEEGEEGQRAILAQDQTRANFFGLAVRFLLLTSSALKAKIMPVLGKLMHDTKVTRHKQGFDY